ncbi:hypothetical protein [Paenibacillus roseipurpureus]|uniref:Oligosaccharide repeat unit polymerase n=1 Tax=Paenibacillus roseopurpureus TaxID=2918901 RepID=A0AA96LRP4_9BACL|nr:hypothetical protein [Paenibacillus sp. MBLB1832]WNR43510.1 hypothetical protein MJB10_20730 [Paenibacillus sp. MBLB1832]
MHKLSQRTIVKRIPNFIIAFISFAISIYVLNNSEFFPGYSVYFIVPFGFSILMILCTNIDFTNFKMIGPFIFNMSMVIKYSLLPLIACISQYYSRFGVTPSADNIRSAIFLTFYEMIVLCIFGNYLSKTYKRKSNKVDQNNKPLRSYFIFNIVILLGILVAVFIPEAIADYRFLFNQDDLATNIKVNFPLSGLFSTVVIFARYCLVLIVINSCFKRNRKQFSYMNIVISIIAVSVNALIVSNLSRVGLICPFITFMVLLLFLYPGKRERKAILFVMSGIITIGLIYLTGVKFFGEGRGEVSDSTNILFWGDTINMYFMGVKETAIGIMAVDTIDVTYGFFRIFLLLNDVFSNVGGISNFTVSSINSTTLYNLVYFGSNISVSQIVPNICEGTYYFGGLFAPIWPCIFLYLAYKFSYKIYEQIYIDKRFVYIFASVYCGMLLMLNTSMIIYAIVNVSFLFAVVSKINRIILFKKHKSSII